MVRKHRIHWEYNKNTSIRCSLLARSCIHFRSCEYEGGISFLWETPERLCGLENVIRASFDRMDGEISFWGGTIPLFSTLMKRQIKVMLSGTSGTYDTPPMDLGSSASFVKASIRSLGVKTALTDQLCSKTQLFPLWHLAKVESVPLRRDFKKVMHAFSPSGVLRHCRYSCS